MNRKNTVKSLSIFCALQILILIVISLYNPSRKTAKAEHCILLNPKYAVNGFSIDNAANGEKMTFVQRSDGIWLCIYEQRIQDAADIRVVFPVQKEKCASFLEILRKSQIVYIISDSANEWDSFFLTDSKCMGVRFFGIQSDFSDTLINFQYFLPENIYEEIYFGKINNTKTGIAVRSSKKAAAYLYPAEIIPYLTTQISFWCDRLVIPDCAQSVLSADNISAVTAVLSETDENAAGRKRVLVSEAAVRKAADRIFSLGSVKFYPRSFLQTFQQYALVLHCELEAADLSKKISVSVFKTEDNRYFVCSDLYNFSVLYVQEISECSFFQLKEVFK
ncbi:MAG: hypothetical protein NC041_04215 [Bacteroides sp.]|nr:hypothetical protein [Prevotella sp.]MCM1407910.1 hypothetical protein [Treponema brennaborense]MCM1469652.1 hypothetical protein [Bacteroides sp.]